MKFQSKFKYFFSNGSILKCRQQNVGHFVQASMHQMKSTWLWLWTFFSQKLNMWHTFCSSLIICVNMKEIWLVLLKIQSGHNFVNRLTDGQTEGRAEGQTEKVNQYTPLNFIGGGGGGGGGWGWGAWGDGIMSVNYLILHMPVLEKILTWASCL